MNPDPRPLAIFSLVLAAISVALALISMCSGCADPSEPPIAWPSITARDGAATLIVDYECDGHGGTARVTIRTALEQVTHPTPYTCGDWSALSVFDAPCGTEVTGWVQIGETVAHADPVTVECAP